MARFCWRERTERLNWRLLRNLQLSDVLRRGDATLLEPYALHLTFAKLPMVVASLAPSRYNDEDDALGTHRDRDVRNAWFFVRVFQLAMEYLLFLRARDGTVVDSLREELLVCERECELLVERARKWKDRSRSGERQVEKLHQVVQSIAKLLQIEGATPSAVSTIESLLRDLSGSKKQRAEPAEPSYSHVEEARVCALCGKMFSSQAFLDKHALRRHPGAEMRVVRDDRKKPSRHERVSETVNNQTDGASDMKAMLRTIEQTLHDYQATLRNVAQEEADKLHSLYEQLHVETQLADGMRSKRVDLEKAVQKQRDELALIEQEKDDVTEEVRVLKGQLQFLTMKKSMAAPSSSLSPAIPQDPTLPLELKRLEETVALLKDALSTAREELQRTHENYGVLLKEKGALEAQLHETQNHTLRLEASLRKAEELVPTMHTDIGVQATVSIVTTAMQTEELRIDPPPPIVIPPIQRAAADEVAMQTDEHVYIDTMIQTDAEVLTPVDASPARTPTDSIGVGVDDSELRISPDDVDSAFQQKCASVLHEIQRRAETSALAAAPMNKTKAYSSLSRRRYLRSRFLHDERAVAERIASHVATLEHTSLRFGVSPKRSVLANEHVEVVQRALQAHLEVLPPNVLQCMVDVDATVTSLIESEWMPQEKARQRALERLTTDFEAKSLVNQGLVRRAMAAFAFGGGGDSHAVESKTEVRAAVVRTETSTEDAPSTPAQSVPQADTTKTTNGNDERDEAKMPALPTSKAMVPATTPASAPTESPSIDMNKPSEALDQPRSDAAEQNETTLQPSPVSVQEVRRHAVTVRAVKVVSVTPKSSPPKSPPRPQPRKDSGAEAVVLPPTMDENQRQSPTIEPATASDSDVTTIPTEAVQAPGTAVMPARGPSSFSAKHHPESQLGIVIPSRYDPPAFDAHGLHDDLSSSEVSPTCELRWSSSVGRSGGASERSFSAVASSEISFDASIPSLGSESVSASQSFPDASTDPLPTIPSNVAEDEPEAAQDADTITIIEGIASLPDETTVAEERDTVETMAVEQEDVAPASPLSQNSPRQAPAPNDVLRFDNDDDLDIEEVMLA